MEAHKPVNPIRELDEHGVQLLTLNRPKRKNAFDEAQWDGLAEALNEAREDPRVAVAVLTGAGGNFSSGADLSAFIKSPPEPRADGHPSAFYACVSAIVAFDKPLLAAVQGVAVGGGCTIAVATDIVYVGESLRMRLPFANLGLVPEIASSYLLQTSIGRQRTAELMFTAEWIDAARAVELGMASRCLPDEALLAATLEKAHEISRWPISSLRAIKQALQATHGPGIEAARAIEDRLMRELAGGPENLEAVQAFLEKRAPDFSRFRGS
ncbi:MAG: enoyl-CoA hydratase/isomerase family protein [Myxococcales bacterium]|nr:enoyl-CoA hydratase/isomerase family protein [Myxococcales bacterium]